MGISQAVSSGAKRAFDLVGATAALVVFAPVLIGCAIAVVATMGRPVFYREVRAGRHAEPFAMLKFRTMRPLRVGETIPEHDQVRITSVGQFLRKTSLDELPSLVNIVRGNMSFVGPRPLPIRYTERYSDDQRRRLEVRPGLTGLAQISGRNGVTWEERFALDVEYVDTRTFVGDLTIIWRTVVPVVTASGIDTEDDTAMPEFHGSR